MKNENNLKAHQLGICKINYGTATLGNTQGRLGGSVGAASKFGSGHDLADRGFELRVGRCADSADPAWDSLSLALCPSPTCSVSQNK